MTLYHVTIPVTAFVEAQNPSAAIAHMKRVVNHCGWGHGFHDLEGEGFPELERAFESEPVPAGTIVITIWGSKKLEADYFDDDTYD